MQTRYELILLGQKICDTDSAPELEKVLAMILGIKIHTNSIVLRRCYLAQSVGLLLKQTARYLKYVQLNLQLTVYNRTKNIYL